MAEGGNVWEARDTPSPSGGGDVQGTLNKRSRRPRLNFLLEKKSDTKWSILLHFDIDNMCNSKNNNKSS